MSKENKFLKNLHRKHEMPIVIVGPEIIKYYFADVTNWDDLLKNIWDEVFKCSQRFSSRIIKSYYNEYNRLCTKYDGDMEKVCDHLLNDLHVMYDELFYDNELKVTGLTPESAHNKKICPFSERIKKYFEKLRLKDDKIEEFGLFLKMLKNVDTVITTQYTNLFIKATLPVHLSNVRQFKGLDQIFERDNSSVLMKLRHIPIMLVGFSSSDKHIKELEKNLFSQFGQMNKKRLCVISMDESDEDTITDLKHTKLTSKELVNICEKLLEIDLSTWMSKIKNMYRNFRSWLIAKNTGFHRRYQDVNILLAAMSITIISVSINKNNVLAFIVIIISLIGLYLKFRYSLYGRRLVYFLLFTWLFIFVSIVVIHMKLDITHELFMLVVPCFVVLWIIKHGTIWLFGDDSKSSFSSRLNKILTLVNVMCVVINLIWNISR